MPCGNSYCLCVLKDTIVVLDSSPRLISSIKSPNLRAESQWAIFQRWVSKGAVVLEGKEYGSVFTSQILG